MHRELSGSRALAQHAAATIGERSRRGSLAFGSLFFLALLQQSATFHAGCLAPRCMGRHRQHDVTSVVARAGDGPQILTDTSADAGGVGVRGRRHFVTGSSLVVGSLLVGGGGACFAQDDYEEEDGAGMEAQEGSPPWAVEDIDFPSYAEKKAWMWKDLRDGNINKANTKLAAQDIFYPQWMFGLWKVESTTRIVEAPLGEELFGRPGALEEAQKDVGVPLSYQARFRKIPGGRVVADRAFNVDSISRAAMGDSAVLECFLEDGNADRLKMTLVPKGAGGRIFDAFLYVTSRDQSTVSEAVDGFGCSETSHQTVVAQNDPIRGNVGGGSVSIPRKASTSVKDIQVIQLFQRPDAKDPLPTTFSSVQRISTFMTEDEFRDKLRAKAFQGPGTAQKFADIKKVPIDVRVYDITYTLVRRGRPGSAASAPASRESSDGEEQDEEA